MLLGKLFMGLIIAGILVIIVMVFFPGFHTAYRSFNFSSYPYVLEAGLTALPYILLGVAVYAVILILGRAAK